jgi:hypothetical protein
MLPSRYAFRRHYAMPLLSDAASFEMQSAVFAAA